MSEGDQQSTVTEEVVAETSAKQAADAPPVDDTPGAEDGQPALNRAQRRALATGKKGAAGPAPMLGNTRGPIPRGTQPASNARIQSRGASRGK